MRRRKWEETKYLCKCVSHFQVPFFMSCDWSVFIKSQQFKVRLTLHGCTSDHEAKRRIKINNFYFIPLAFFLVSFALLVAQNFLIYFIAWQKNIFSHHRRPSLNRMVWRFLRTQNTHKMTFQPLLIAWRDCKSQQQCLRSFHCSQLNSFIYFLFIYFVNLSCLI